MSLELAELFILSPLKLTSLLVDRKVNITIQLISDTQTKNKCTVSTYLVIFVCTYEGCPLAVEAGCSAHHSVCIGHSRHQIGMSVQHVTPHGKYIPLGEINLTVNSCVLFVVSYVVGALLSLI